MTTIEKTKYSMVVTMNDKEYKIDTDDIEETMLALSPEWLKTKIIMKIKEGNKLCDKMFLLPEGKQFYRNKIYREHIIRNLIFK